MRDGQRPVAADNDERAQSHLVKHFDDAIRVVVRAFGGADGIGERIAAVGRAEDRAAEPENAGDVARPERPDRSGSISPSKLSSRPTHSMPRVRGRLDNGTNHGVQAGRVTAAGEDAESRNG